LGVCTYSSVSHDTDGESCGLNECTITRELKPQQSPEARCA
jgi:hypothetical protein